MHKFGVSDFGVSDCLTSASGRERDRILGFHEFGISGNGVTLCNLELAAMELAAMEFAAILELSAMDWQWCV